MQTALAQRLRWVQCAVEAVYHRHNVSAILRTCDALGIHHVHLIEGNFKPSPGAARGAERWLSIHHHDDPVRAIRSFQTSGARVFVADLTEDALLPEDLPLDRPVVLWFGAELAGVSPEAREAADGAVSIPMRGFAQSLNVSVAAALALRPVADAARMRGQEALLTDEERESVWAEWMTRAENIDRQAARRAAHKLPQET
jgi:tRNA (guanosine-2'-O-)-methyltransferase